MKITLVTLVVVVALSTKALGGAAPEQVVDTSGKKVRAGGNYYVVPASPDVGGLSLASTGQDCPLDVVAVDGYQGVIPSSIVLDLTCLKTSHFLPFPSMVPMLFRTSLGCYLKN
ncbi:Trypsin inhibitor 2 [Spatholobus suberectus]|nr:Trypsin inhibitor 2 [Spatholobus suberectus]